MNTKFLIYIGLILLINFNIVYSQNFDVWAVGPNIFTIGKNEILNIYVKNNGNNVDNYNISYTKYATDSQAQNVSHLININFQSNYLSNVRPNETGVTYATIVILGQIRDGSIIFNVTSQSSDITKSYNITNIKVAFPIILNEFELIGLLVLLSSLLYFKIKY